MVGWFGLFSSAPKVVVDRVELPGPFDYTNKNHMNLIQAHMTKFKEALSSLQWTDKIIVLGATLVTSGTVGSYVFPFTTPVIIGGAAMAARYHALRPQISKHYFEALRDLIEIYQWSMKEGSKDYWYKLGAPTLQELILTLGPWVSSKTIHTWNDVDLESSIVFKRESDVTAAFKQQLIQFQSGVQAAQFAFRLYGEDGGMDNILSGIKDRASAFVGNNVSSLVAKRN